MYQFFLHLLTLLGINIILASSLNIINGFCGLFSLGHAGFFAVGSYAAAIFTTIAFPEFAAAHPVLALVIGSGLGFLAACVAGAIVGIPCLRLTGDYLAIATIGFSEIIRIVLLNWDYVGGSRGLTSIPKLTDLSFGSEENIVSFGGAPITLLAAAIVIILIYNFMRSSYGRCVLSIREDEIAARSMGIDVRFYKTFSFIVAAGFAGFAGALFAHYQEFIAPNSFNFQLTVNVLLMIVIGGLGSFRGAVLGAAIVTVVPELLRFHETLSQARMLIFGIIMILLMLLQPEGIMGFFKKKELKLGNS
jgi:branched-chain amino acid transport system permease protein